MAQALWNRALALAGLDLPLSAANVFDAVAALGEPGWSAEARGRAAALRGRIEPRRLAWRRALDEGRAMVLDGKLPSPATIREVPGLTRLHFYDAVRAAPSRQRVLGLLPVAAALDAEAGGSTLTDYARRIAALDFHTRAPLAEQYHTLYQRQSSLAPAEVRTYLERFDRAEAADLFLGAFVLTGRDPSHLEKYAALAHATKDPWFSAMADQYVAHQELARGDPTAAERRLTRALASCRMARLEYRCQRLSQTLTDLLTTLHRLNEAHALAIEERRLAYAVDFGTEVVTFQGLADIARYRGDASLTAAYLEESMACSPDSCVTRRFAHEMLATLAFQRLMPDEARRQLEQALCPGGSHTLTGAWVLANLVRYHGTPKERQALDRVFVEQRARASLAAREAAFLDMLEGRVRLEQDRAAGQTLLARTLDRVRPMPSADSLVARVRSEAEIALIMDAAQHGEHAQAMVQIAAHLAVVPPPRCAVGVAVDDNRQATVVIDSRGAALGRFAARTNPLPAPEELVPANLRAALADCAEVHVLALPPLHGNPQLLPPSLAWGFGVGRQAAAPSPPSHGLIVSDVQPPASLGLPHLSAQPAMVVVAGATVLRGADATPSRVLAELPQADAVEFDVHGLVDLGLSDASLLVLSPDREGKYTLSVAEIRRLRLSRAPVVLLGSCQAARAAPYLHEAWSLPMAFVHAGARAVLGSPMPIPDAGAAAFFGGLLRRIKDGTSPAVALRDERMAWRARGDSWVEQIALFE
jgi:hypothetical protein